MKLTGKCAVVTGGNRGIGAAIVRALELEGAQVTAFSSKTADVSDSQAIAKVFAKCARVDILINNAGQAASAPFLKTDAETWRRMIAVNLDGAYHCTQAALPKMIEAGWGRIVNISSVAGLTGYAYVTAYCAAKHGLIGLTRALAVELAAKGVTVNAVCPGFTETDMAKRAIANIVAKTGRTIDEAHKNLISRTPQQRLIRPEEVASAVVWLCLPESESITGQAIEVAGGKVF
jgi:NAD(P)-dependent dehydrogenase (short-subunit alcohol dehydrogenase family)